MDQIILLIRWKLGGILDISIQLCSICWDREGSTLVFSRNLTNPPTCDPTMVAHPVLDPTLATVPIGYASCSPSNEVEENNSIKRRGHNRNVGTGRRLKTIKRRGKQRKGEDSRRKSVAATDSDIIRCNDAFWKTYDSEQAKRKDGSVAQKIATMAMEVGVTGFGDKHTLVKAIQSLEDRDDLAKADSGLQDKLQ